MILHRVRGYKLAKDNVHNIKTYLVLHLDPLEAHLTFHCQSFFLLSLHTCVYTDNERFLEFDKYYSYIFLDIH